MPKLVRMPGGRDPAVYDDVAEPQSLSLSARRRRGLDAPRKRRLGWLLDRARRFLRFVGTLCLPRRWGDDGDLLKGRLSYDCDGETLLGSPLHAADEAPPPPPSVPGSRESSVSGHSPPPPPSPVAARFFDDGYSPSPVVQASRRKSTASRLDRAVSDLPPPPSPRESQGVFPEDAALRPRMRSFEDLRTLSSRKAAPAALLDDDDDPHSRLSRI